MSIKAIVPVIVIAVALLNMNAAALVFLDPKTDHKEAQKHLASSLVRYTGEKALMYEGHEMNLRAESVLALVRGPYDAWRTVLRKALLEKIGIASEGEVISKGIKDTVSADNILYQYPDGPLLGEGFVGFAALGIRVERPVEYRIHTVRYNQIEDISGYSELEVRLGNGKDIFGKDCTLIVIKRTDHSKEWYRHFQLGIPLPFKHFVSEDLVTSTEIKLVEDAAISKGGVPVEYFVPYPGVRGTDYWHDFVGKILRTVETF